MFSQDFYCKHESCLPDYAKSLEGLSVVKLLKLLVIFKYKPGCKKNYIETKNLLNHLYDSTQNIYKFTAFAKNKLHVDLEEDVFFCCARNSKKNKWKKQ